METHDQRVTRRRLELKEIEERTIELHKQKCAQRQDANREIIGILAEQVEKNPDLRFGQLVNILIATDAKPNLDNEESVDTLERIKHSRFIEQVNRQ